ncbi:hypothetical protein BIU14_06195 [Campylobacter fetus]|uniref:hypothetical protein n=1 Tax=Campylobacter fetus TaxID=196 RepID=UPI000508F094|nr:hypothetical protein [Campylobacter fetus]WKW17883.1 hypothetical protein IXZ25_03005 [Campylobacter fetus subsp. fetus]AIR78508.1 hypothetical protein CFF04554_0569 [Campylobacter fetus subsp. fetus 04/554]EAI5647803.1 hypothetical protein [Campylobacter fetus]EAI5945540.1 hypothetical protein [Campylobacter fetus]EAJ0319735.1 hypothetical protein [Campylobacter fetus]
MRKPILFVLFCVSMIAGTLHIDNFESDLYSKSGANNMKKISMSLEFIARDENVNESAIYDSLNVVVGSFYAEDLMTSRGKESFKTTLIKYISKKYSLDIDEIYIISLKILNEIDIEKIIKAIKERDLCPTNNGAKNKTDNYNLNLNKDFGKDFGEN